MARRRKMSRRKSKRNFKRGTRIKRQNRTGRVMRGGYRL